MPFCKALACLLSIFPKDGTKPRLGLPIHEVEIDVRMHAEPRLLFNGPVRGCDKFESQRSARCCEAIGMLTAIDGAVLHRRQSSIWPKPRTCSQKSCMRNMKNELEPQDCEQLSPASKWPTAWTAPRRAGQLRTFQCCRRPVTQLEYNLRRRHGPRP